jgi:hypothetical protein
MVIFGYDWGTMGTVACRNSETYTQHPICVIIPGTIRFWKWILDIRHMFHFCLQILNSSVFWDIMLCSPLKINWRFGRTCSACHLLSWWFLVWLILGPCRWRRHVPPKRWLTFKGLHGVISQEVELYITTAVRTSNSTNFLWNIFHSSKYLLSPAWVMHSNACKSSYKVVVKIVWSKQKLRWLNIFYIILKYQISWQFFQWFWSCSMHANEWMNRVNLICTLQGFECAREVHREATNRIIHRKIVQSL